MATTGQSILVGVFEEETKARKALEEFRRAGFDEQQAGIVPNARNLLNQRKIANLANFGIPEEEFSAEQIVVFIMYQGGKQRIIDILRKNGSCDHFSLNMTVGPVSAHQAPE